MRRYSLVLFLIATAWMLGDHPMSAQQKPEDPCPLNLRRGIPEVAREREAKKRRMRENGVPERYLHLLDKYECIECIRTAPDAVHVTIVYKDEFAPRLSNGSIDKVYTIRLLPQIERQLRDELSTGRIESFHVWISEKRCYCCPDDEDKQPEDYDDWDDDIGANMDQADSFDDPSDLPPLPDDLKGAPGGWVPPPPIENFSKPRRRYMHVVCDACQGLADQWNTAAGGLDFLWDRKVSLQRQINLVSNAIGNRNNEINDLRYEQRFNTTRSYDRMKQIEQLEQYNASHQSDIERDERELENVERLIEEQQARMDALMKRVLECEKACKKTTTATQMQVTTPPSAPVASTPATVPAAPAPPAAPQCPNCDEIAAAAERVAAQIAEREAERSREAGALQINDGNINNLRVMRGEAVSRGTPERVQEIDAEIAKLQEAGRSIRARMFALQQEIQRLNEQLDDLNRELIACNRRCVTTSGSTFVDTNGPREVVAPPISAVAACKDCEQAAENLRKAHAELVRIAQRANDLARDDDFEAFEAQRVIVARLESELAECNRTRCATTANTTTDINTTGGNTPTTTGTSAEPPVLCELCRDAAKAVAAIQNQIQQRQAERDRLNTRLSTNAANLNNLQHLRAAAARRGDAARLQEFDSAIAALRDANRELQSQVFNAEEAVRKLNEDLERANRALDDCNRTRCNTTTDQPPTFADPTGKRTVGANPLAITVVCLECEDTANLLRKAHLQLQRLAQIANDRQFNSDFEDFETQRRRVAELEEALALCNKRKPCTPPTTTATTTGNTPQMNTTGQTPTGAAVQDVPPAPTLPVTPTPVTYSAPVITLCPDCRIVAGSINQLQREIDELAAYVDTLRMMHAVANEALESAQKEERAFRAQRRLAAGASLASVPGGPDVGLQVGHAYLRFSAVHDALKDAGEDLEEMLEQLAELRQELENCEKTHCPKTTGANGIGVIPSMPVSTPLSPPVTTNCTPCSDEADDLTKAKHNLESINNTLRNIRDNQTVLNNERARLAKEGTAASSRMQSVETQRSALNDAFARVSAQQIAAIADINRLEGLLEDCQKRCVLTTSNEPLNRIGTPTTPALPAPTGCLGDACAPTACLAPGSATGCVPTPDMPVVNIGDPGPWNFSGSITIVINLVQIKFAEFFDNPNFQTPSNSTVPQAQHVVVPAAEALPVREWFNPLGLLARHIRGQVDRWRGSAGPRPFLTTRDLKLIDAYSGSQAAGLPKGVHVMLTDRGGSTGKTMGLQILNLTGRPVRLAAMPIAIEPIQQRAAEKVQEAFGRLSKALPMKIDLNAYCVEMLKAPPSANTLYRLAPREIQEKFAPMSKVLQAAYRIKTEGLLHPDSNPAAYTDSIKQWAIWAVEQKLNESRYTDAFLAHTKKNVEGGGQKWSKQAEDVIRQVSPNRWRDIAQVLRGAGVPIPQ